MCCCAARHLVTGHVSHLGHVGDLWGGPVPGVHQHRVIWLLPPARLPPVHLRQPVCGGPGSLVPANDHASVSPSAAEASQTVSLWNSKSDLLFVFYHLTHPVLHVRRPHVPGLRTLTKVTILVPEPEDLDCWALAQGVSEGVQQVLQLGAHQPVAPAPPGRRTQPVVTKLRYLIDHLRDRVGPEIIRGHEISSAGLQ